MKTFYQVFFLIFMDQPLYMNSSPYVHKKFIFEFLHFTQSAPVLSRLTKLIVVQIFHIHTVHLFALFRFRAYIQTCSQVK